MLSPNVIVLEALSFFLSETQDFPGPRGELIKSIPVAHVCIAPLIACWGITANKVYLKRRPFVILYEGKLSRLILTSSLIRMKMHVMIKRFDMQTFDPLCVGYSKRSHDGFDERLVCKDIQFAL